MKHTASSSKRKDRLVSMGLVWLGKMAVGGGVVTSEAKGVEQISAAKAETRGLRWIGANLFG